MHNATFDENQNNSSSVRLGAPSVALILTKWRKLSPKPNKQTFNIWVISKEKYKLKKTLMQCSECKETMF